MPKDFVKSAAFEYVPPSQKFLDNVPRKYSYFNYQTQHYYAQYQQWQKRSDDPALRNSNLWADNWEICGKFL